MQAISRPFFAAVLAILVSMAWPANAKVSPSFAPLVLKPESEKYQSWYEGFRDGGQLDGIANALSQGIKLPTYVWLATKECGRVSAYYAPDMRAIALQNQGPLSGSGLQWR